MLNAVILSVALTAPPCHQPHYHILPIPQPQRYYYQPVPRYYIQPYPYYQPQPIYRRPGFNFYFGF